MKKMLQKILKLSFFILILVPLCYAAGTHEAEQINPGSFVDGEYTFPSLLLIGDPYALRLHETGTLEAAGLITANGGVIASYLNVDTNGDDPSTLFVDHSDDEVGIYNDDPEAELHIKGNANNQDADLILERTGSNPSKWGFSAGSNYLAIFDLEGVNIPFIIYDGAPANSIAIYPGGPVTVSTDLQLSGDLIPASGACISNQILKKNGLGEWVCDTDETGGSGSSPWEDAGEGDIRYDDGDVGIGTNPESTLDVDGTIRAIQLCDENGESCKDISAGWASGGAGDGHSLDAADGSPENVVYVNNDGDVGVGTSSPANKLDVYSGTYNRVIVNPSDASFELVDSEGFMYIDFRDDGQDYQGRFGYSVTDGFSFAGGFGGSGNVGIGTDIPEGTLHLYADADPATIYDTGAATNWYVGLDDSDSDKLKIGTGTDVGSNSRITVMSGGNVGIGTSSPTQKLDVNGDVRVMGGDLDLDDPDATITLGNDGAEIIEYDGSIIIKLGS